MAAIAAILKISCRKFVSLVHSNKKWLVAPILPKAHKGLAAILFEYICQLRELHCFFTLNDKFDQYVFFLVKDRGAGWRCVCVGGGRRGDRGYNYLFMFE